MGSLRSLRSVRFNSTPRVQTGVRPRRRWLRALLGLALLVMLLVAPAAIWLAVDPDAIPETVDAARGMFGAQAVAQVETVAFDLQDQLQRARYQATGTSPGLQWAATAEPAQPSTVAARLPHPGSVTANSTTAGASASSGGLQAQKLLDGMKGNEQQFIAADNRDFFYLTSKP